MSTIKKTIHVYSEGEYMGNIMYNCSIHLFTEEELEGLFNLKIKRYES